MAKHCKVCQSKLRDDIDAYLMGGATITWLVEWCNSRGFSVSAGSISNHAKSHVAGYSNKTSVVKQVTEKRSPGVEPEPNVVNFMEFLERLGVEPSDIENLHNNVDKVIEAEQRALTVLTFIEMAIVDHKLRLHAQGKAGHPNDQIKGLKQLFDIQSKAIAWDNLVNPNVAIQTLESMGYAIQGVIDVSPDPSEIN